MPRERLVHLNAAFRYVRKWKWNDSSGSWDACSQGEWEDCPAGYIYSCSSDGSQYHFNLQSSSVSHLILFQPSTHHSQVSTSLDSAGRRMRIPAIMQTPHQLQIDNVEDGETIYQVCNSTHLSCRGCCFLMHNA